jgi:hypothetical protein
MITVRMEIKWLARQDPAMIRFTAPR